MLKDNKYIKKLSLLLLFIIIILMIYPDILYYIYPDYINIKILHWKAKRTYKTNKYEAFIIYKLAIKKSHYNNHIRLKYDIFNELEDKYINKEYYYVYLENILYNQFILKRGFNYPYSVSNIYRLLNIMIYINKNKTINIFKKMDRNSLNVEMKNAYDYIISFDK